MFQSIVRSDLTIKWGDHLKSASFPFHRHHDLIKSALIALIVIVASSTATAQVATLSWSQPAGGTAYFLSGVSTASQQWVFLEENIFEVTLWKTNAKPGTNPRVTLTPSQFVSTRTGNTVTMVSSTFGLQVTLTFTPTALGFTAAASLVQSGSTDYGVDSFEFPRIRMQPPVDPSSMYATHGYLGGYTIKEPNTRNIEGYGYSPEAPGSMQFWSFYDSANNKDHIYFQTEDTPNPNSPNTYGYAKRWSLRGGGDIGDTMFYWTQYPPNGRKPFVSYSQPWVFRCELLASSVENGVLAYYDAAIRYREWATQSGHPWMSRGPWRDVTNGAPSAIRNTDVLAVLGKPTASRPSVPFDQNVEELARVQACLGIVASPTTSDPIITPWYDWYNHSEPAQFDEFIPDFLPPANPTGFSAALALARSKGIVVCPYEANIQWDADVVSGQFDYSNYSTFGSIGQYVCVDHTLMPFTDSYAPFPFPSGGIRNWRFFDQANSSVPAITASVLNAHFTAALPALPGGIYMDFFAGSGPLPSYDPAVSPNGNHGAWEHGKKQTLLSARAQLMTHDPNVIILSEGCDEGLIPAYDMAFPIAIGRNSLGTDLYGTLTWLFPIVYGEYLRTATFDNVFTPVGVRTDRIQSGLYATHMASVWHSSGMICYNNAVENLLDPVAQTPTYWINQSPAFGTPLTLVQMPMTGFVQAMGLLHATKPQTKPFFEGRRMRPLPTSWEADYVESGASGPVEYLSGGFVSFMSSVWRRPDGTIGIVFTNLHPTLTESLSITLQSVNYGLNPATSHSVDLIKTSLSSAAICPVQTTTQTTSITTFTSGLTNYLVAIPPTSAGVITISP